MDDASTILLQLHGRLLRQSSLGGGVAAASRDLLRQGRIDNRLKRKLCTLDSVAAWLRHATGPLCAQLAAQLDQQLGMGTCTPPSGGFGTDRRAVAPFKVQERARIEDTTPTGAMAESAGQAGADSMHTKLHPVQDSEFHDQRETKFCAKGYEGQEKLNDRAGYRRQFAGEAFRAFQRLVQNRGHSRQAQRARQPAAIPVEAARREACRIGEGRDRLSSGGGRQGRELPTGDAREEGGLLPTGGQGEQGAGAALWCGSAVALRPRPSECQRPTGDEPLQGLRPPCARQACRAWSLPGLLARGHGVCLVESESWRRPETHLSCCGQWRP